MTQIDANDEWRYERKCLIQTLSQDTIVQAIKRHPAGFKDIYYPRYINNIYFDTQDLASYDDNVNGKADRLKVRIRWYGDLLGEIEAPNLELKIKKGCVGKKESYPLKSMILKTGDTDKPLSHYVNVDSISNTLYTTLADLNSTLINRYCRRYFLSLDQRYRLTLDTELQYYDPQSKSLTGSKDAHTKIVEIKYYQDADNDAEDICSAFPFNSTKSSKYVLGIEQLSLTCK
jgi:hypothetical protein